MKTTKRWDNFAQPCWLALRTDGGPGRRNNYIIVYQCNRNHVDGGQCMSVGTVLALRWRSTGTRLGPLQPAQSPPHRAPLVGSRRKGDLKSRLGNKAYQSYFGLAISCKLCYSGNKMEGDSFQRQLYKRFSSHDRQFINKNLRLT